MVKGVQPSPDECRAAIFHDSNWRQAAVRSKAREVFSWARGGVKRAPIFLSLPVNMKLPHSSPPMLPVALTRCPVNHGARANFAPLLDKPLGTESPKDPPLSPTPGGTRAVDKYLKNIQGNILKSHGRDYTRLILFWFDGAAGPQDAALRKLFPDAVAAGLVTTAYQQWNDSRKARARWQKNHPDSDYPPTGSPESYGRDPFYSLAISLSGMKRCGYGDDDFPVQGPVDSKVGFGQPANATFNQLGDAPCPANPSSPDWEECYRAGSGPDGVWLLAHDRKEGPRSLKQMEKKVVKFLRHHGAATIEIEDGFTWTDTADNVREPFGFRDGLSDPLFFAADCEPGPQGLQVPKWINIPRRQVLIEKNSPHDGGSFLVLRKLEQNVKAFRDFEAAIKLSMPRAATGPTEAGALLIGRERDGTPLAELTAPGPKTGPNKFEFEADVSRCPFHAHIRKSNPRIDTSGNTNLDALFVRRSAVYDPHHRLPAPGKLKPEEAATYPEGDRITAGSEVGLLFMGYMSSIGDQFVRMQRDWFANPTFPVTGTNFGDPLLRPQATGQDWTWQPAPGAPAIDAPVPANFQPVAPKGGAYFYVPSIAWLSAQHAPAADGRA